ncbi:thioesterase domain-containing protein [Chryseobacterium gambrini]|uniref:Thioesterase domain-containing protein n=1 Tax=Chryseobacterium gambrini TaxID=373672 RepID=A0AAJ1VJK8_9FLAO|nr:MULTISPECIES: alpha/beta fold hydrolase [Chryseobacterium]MDN4011781.1 thioesterase domain-containing protein [Chryseobacterium gambrini]MDN4029514.1 thioesterase domain-containing protein [Chryseobacterium gambrini]QWA40724.1 thioesterase [Chryseobacterium sp. ZHDP1]
MNKQLFLLHFAGGNKYSYNFLQSKLKSDIEFIPIELPGRGARFEENLIRDKEEAIQDLFLQIKDKRNGKPYVIYGHSMGAILGFSVTEMLEKENDAPNYLIVSGNPGPLEDHSFSLRYNLDDETFKKRIAELGGVPDEIIENQETFAFFSTIMRADFECVEKDRQYEKNKIIQTPIYAIMGSEENLSARIRNWENFTNSSFNYLIFEGNHFFIHHHSREIGKLINYCFV